MGEKNINRYPEFPQSCAKVTNKSPEVATKLLWVCLKKIYIELAVTLLRLYYRKTIFLWFTDNRITRQHLQAYWTLPARLAQPKKLNSWCEMIEIWMERLLKRQNCKCIFSQCIFRSWQKRVFHELNSCTVHWYVTIDPLEQPRKRKSLNWGHTAKRLVSPA